MTHAMRKQFESFPDLFPSSMSSSETFSATSPIKISWSYKNPYNADFIACASCKNITLRLMYAKIQVLSRDDADALLSRGFTCVTEVEAVGNMARTYSESYFLGEADVARLNRLIVDANSDEEVAHALDGPLAELFRQKHSEKALQNAEEIIKTFFSSYWPLLDPGTQERLTLAEYLRQDFLYQSECGHTPNFAPSVILYSSALEIELLQKVFYEFQRYSKGIFEIDNSIDNRRLKNYNNIKLFCEGKRKLTLGDIGFIFLHVACSKSGKNSFQEFLDRIGLQPNRLCGHYGIASRINDYTTRYRNEAAHTGHISAEQCNGARAYLIQEPRELLIALIRAVVNAV